MLNKNGYVMIYALGAITLLMFLAASLTNITMMRSKWSNSQVLYIQEANIAKAYVEAAASELANHFEELNQQKSAYLPDIISDIELYFNTVKAKYDNIEIERINTNDNHYSYEYLISYTGKEVFACKKMFLSVMPSFLFFALGSNSDLTLNGGSFIDGDMYVNSNHNLYLSNVANYMLNGTLYVNQPSAFPTFSTSSSIYYNDDNYPLEACFYSSDNDCFAIDDNTIYRNGFAPADFDFVFIDNKPTVRKYPNRFLDVNIDESFLYYIIKDVIKNPALYPDLDTDNIQEAFDEFIADELLELYPTSDGIYDNSVLLNISADISDDEKFIFDKDNNEIRIINDFNIETDFGLNKDEHWVIVDGNLEFRNYDNNKLLTIEADFLVTGNVTITGNVNLNSTIYALKEGVIFNASININADYDDQLVLLTKDRLKFSNINEFLNTFTGIEIASDNRITINPNIRGFFYTNSFAEIYAVNSYYVIEGGIFSNGSSIPITNTSDAYGLLVNAFRGEVYYNSGSFEFFPAPGDFTMSRFVISYSPKVLENHPKGLPVNKQFNYLFETTSVQRL